MSQIISVKVCEFVNGTLYGREPNVYRSAVYSFYRMIMMYNENLWKNYKQQIWNQKAYNWTRMAYC